MTRAPGSRPLEGGAGNQLTRPFAEAVAEAERLIEGADFVRTEQDLAEGYEYLAGSIRASLQLAFGYDLEHPLFINSTHQYSKQGLDNPDAIYFHAYISGEHEYVVTGRRGTTADLSFQVMNGNYSPAEAPDSVAAFDDRALEVAEDGTFEVRFGPARDDAPVNYFVLAPDSSILIVREVYSDWTTEERGELRIHRVDTLGTVPGPPSMERVAKRYAVAAKMLVGRIKTWFAFPEWFTYQEPVNTLTVPASTPGGLESQYSSIGHYELTEEQALVQKTARIADSSTRTSPRSRKRRQGSMLAWWSKPLTMISSPGLILYSRAMSSGTFTSRSLVTFDMIRDSATNRLRREGVVPRRHAQNRYDTPNDTTG